MTTTKLEEPTAAAKVDQIEKGIEEAKARSTEIAGKIGALEGRLASVLSEIEPDEAAIDEIEEKRDALVQELQRLDTRITALAESLPEARRAIDEESLQAAIEAHPKLLQEVNQAVAEWREAAKSLTALAEAAKRVREKSWELRELSDKVRYLEVLLELPWTEFPVQDLLNEKELDEARAALEDGLQIHRFPPLSFRKTRWARETEELRDQRRKAEAEARDRREYERQRGEL